MGEPARLCLMTYVGVWVNWVRLYFRALRAYGSGGSKIDYDCAEL